MQAKPETAEEFYVRVNAAYVRLISLIDKATSIAIDRTTHSKHSFITVRNRLHSHIDIRRAQVQLWLQQQLEAGTTDAPEFFPIVDTPSFMKDVERFMQLFYREIYDELDRRSQRN